MIFDETATNIGARDAVDRTVERRRHRVLLVDDDQAGRARTASSLAERGWHVIEAGGGAHALELFSANQPDVIVLDALMPEIDGFVTCERLRGLPGGEHVPVLMV